ncbi:MAG: response regulator transcription factor [Colwellia sp.]|nr:response regulator transcription factor [Colwellia sp.]
MSYSVVAIDDEKLALDLICDYVEKTPFLSLKARFRDAFLAIDYLSKHSVDLLLIDINMPSLNGIDLVSSLPTPPKVVFITAHADYALQGFELNALDYLVKPVRYSKFLKTANKLVETATFSLHHKTTTSPHNECLSFEDGYIFIKVDNRYERVELADIRYIEAYGDYVIYYLNKGKLLSIKTMTQVLETIQSRDFIRVHRSYIVNLRHVDTVHRDYLVIGKQDISISKSYLKELQCRLN